MLKIKQNILNLKLETVFWATLSDKEKSVT